MFLLLFWLAEKEFRRSRQAQEKEKKERKEGKGRCRTCQEKEGVCVCVCVCVECIRSPMAGCLACDFVDSFFS